jgi:pyrroloquinoline-quinone synthase
VSASPWSRDGFEAELRKQGSAYHIHHPFNVLLKSGEASREQIRGWVANRYYYQISIPIKDAAILSNCPDRAVRRNWVQRILDHDGYGDDPGGIDSWLRLGEAVGLPRESVDSLSEVLPGVRFAVDAYVNFARRAPWQEAVCSSLTELFAPEIHKQRLDNWPQHYPWIDLAGLKYFQSRVSLARRGVRPQIHIGSFRDACAAGAGARDTQIQTRRALADERCDGASLRGAGMSAEAVEGVSRPSIGHGFRLQWEAAQNAYVLLFPEGMIKLNGSAGEIMKRCTGLSTIAEITADLERTFETSGLAHDVIAFVEMARGKQWLSVSA